MSRIQSEIPEHEKGWEFTWSVSSWECARSGTSLHGQLQTVLSRAESLATCAPLAVSKSAAVREVLYSGCEIRQLGLELNVFWGTELTTEKLKKNITKWGSLLCSIISMEMKKKISRNKTAVSSLPSVLFHYFFFTFSIPWIMIELPQCKTTKAQKSSESQYCYNTSTATCLGPYWPIIRECTVA